MESSSRILNISNFVSGKAVAYCRVSSIGQQRNGTGLYRQEEIIAEYAKQAGYELIEVYHEAMTVSDADRTRSLEF